MKILSIIAIFALTIMFNQCENEAVFRCMYTADGNIPSCFEHETDDDSDIKKACTAFGGNVSEAVCSSDGKIGRCDGATLPLQSLGIGNLDSIGKVTYALYTPATDSAAQDFCLSTLNGVYTSGQ